MRCNYDSSWCSNQKHQARGIQTPKRNTPIGQYLASLTLPDSSFIAATIGSIAFTCVDSASAYAVETMNAETEPSSGWARATAVAARRSLCRDQQSAPRRYWHRQDRFFRYLCHPKSSKSVSNIVYSHVRIPSTNQDHCQSEYSEYPLGGGPSSAWDNIVEQGTG
jgi:hypothetical protein